MCITLTLRGRGARARTRHRSRVPDNNAKVVTAIEYERKQDEDDGEERNEVGAHSVDVSVVTRFMLVVLVMSLSQPSGAGGEGQPRLSRATSLRASRRDNTEGTESCAMKVSSTGMDDGDDEHGYLESVEYHLL